MYEYSILTSVGLVWGGYRKDPGRAKTEARRRSARVTSLIVVVTQYWNGEIIAAYERGEPTPLDKAQFVADHGYRALADTGWVT